MSLFNQTNITNFVLDIPDGGLTEAFVLNVQSFHIPGVRIPITDTVTGPKGQGRSLIPGSTFEHDPIEIRFLVDENLESWLQMYRWMLSLNNYVTQNSEAWQPNGQPEGIILHILDNSKTKIVLSFHFYGAWPTDLSSIEYSFSEEGDPAMICTCQMNFKYFEVIKDGKVMAHKPTIKAANEERLQSFNMHPSMR